MFKDGLHEKALKAPLSPPDDKIWMINFCSLLDGRTMNTDVSELLNKSKLVNKCSYLMVLPNEYGMQACCVLTLQGSHRNSKMSI